MFKLSARRYEILDCVQYPFVAAPHVDIRIVRAAKLYPVQQLAAIHSSMASPAATTSAESSNSARST